MKTLYYVPMIHSPDELGSLRKSVIQAHAEIYGDNGLKSFLNKIEEYWDEARERIAKAGFYGPKAASLHIFVDGLPNASEDVVRKIVGDLIASRTIPAYQIIAKLQKHGARVHGTEDIKLLLEEYKYFKDLSEGKSGDATTVQARLIARDVAISSRIQEVMTDDNDTGIIFIGKAHDVISKLPDEFTVICL
ncbi:MAG: hypothetical protein Q8N81_08170 [bacterium]|nr:hypothetical protein [bacterium]